jgi:hypothetical protein
MNYGREVILYHLIIITNQTCYYEWALVVLCCAVLCCAVLCYVELCCILSCCKAQHCDKSCLSVCLSVCLSLCCLSAFLCPYDCSSVFRFHTFILSSLTRSFNFYLINYSHILHLPSSFSSAFSSCESSSSFITGGFVYVQLRVQQHATFHLEVLTTKDLSVRLTVSTLYAEDKARFLGTSLRYCTYCSVL